MSRKLTPADYNSRSVSPEEYNISLRPEGLEIEWDLFVTFSGGEFELITSGKAHDTSTAMNEAQEAMHRHTLKVLEGRSRFGTYSFVFKDVVENLYQPPLIVPPPMPLSFSDES